MINVVLLISVLKEMRNKMKKRESFKSRSGFILACIGSAVGMGNIWMFPTRVSLYGGGSFLIPYLIFVVLIASTGVIGEMSFGRATRSGPIDAFGYACEKKGKRKVGELLGGIPVNRPVARFCISLSSGIRMFARESLTRGILLNHCLLYRAWSRIPNHAELD